MLANRRRATGQWLAVLALMGLGLGAVAQAAPQIQHWTTDNGARVYFVHAPELPMVDIRVVFDAGAARDGDQPGLARLTNGLLSEGAGDWDADTIAERFDDVGASFGTSSRRDMALVRMRSLTDPDLLDPALTTLATVISAPTFPQDALQRQRQRMLVALQGQQESPNTIAGKRLYKAMFGDHPYGSDPAGTKESLEAMTRAHVQDFYSQYYVARNATVAIVGAVEQARAEKLAQALTGDLPAGEPASELPPAEALESAQMVTVNHPSAQSHIRTGQPAVSRSHEDYFPLYVGNHVLGGGGLVSRLSETIRQERGLSYSVFSYLQPMHRGGLLAAGLQTRNDQAREALKVLRQEIQTFTRDGPQAEELEDAKKHLSGSFPLRIASNSDIVSQVAMIGFYDLPLDYLDTFIPKIEAVDREAIRQAFQAHIHPERMATVVVGGAADDLDGQ